jgi:hypothetical protein
MEAPEHDDRPRALRQKGKRAIEKKKAHKTKVCKMDSSIEILVRHSLPLRTYSSELRLIYDIIILAGRSRSAGEDRRCRRSGSCSQAHEGPGAPQGHQGEGRGKREEGEEGQGGKGGQGSQGQDWCLGFEIQRKRDEYGIDRIGLTDGIGHSRY